MSETTIPINTDSVLAADDLQAMIDRYFTCWNTIDLDVRRTTLEQTWTAQAHMVDPVYDVTGHADLLETFAGFHDAYPGGSFRQIGGVDAHHNFVRWGWEMRDADGNVTLNGLDLALFDADGRIGHLVGFFGVALPTI